MQLRTMITANVVDNQSDNKAIIGSFVQTMAWRPVNTKLSSGRMPINLSLEASFRDIWITMGYISCKKNAFKNVKKCYLQNDSHYV